MTILEAIKESVGYPISNNRASMALIKRGILNAGEEVTQSFLNSKEFELATADLMFWLITTANVSEGGYSVSLTEKASIKAIASGIYSKWGVSDPSEPTVKFVQKW